MKSGSTTRLVVLLITKLAGKVILAHQIWIDWMGDMKLGLFYHYLFVINMKFILKVTIPLGQSVTVQFPAWLIAPKHVPPRQVLARYLIPSPQMTSHRDHGPHSLHPIVTTGPSSSEESVWQKPHVLGHCRLIKNGFSLHLPMSSRLSG